MARKRSKAVSFDAMVKFFMQAYDIPTKKDVRLILDRLDRLERMVSGLGSRRRRGVSTGKKSGTQTASDVVLEVIRSSNQALGLSQIQARTGFGEKKLRNIIFRLHKQGKIRRVSRGIYTASRRA